MTITLTINDQSFTAPDDASGRNILIASTVYNMTNCAERSHHG